MKKYDRETKTWLEEVDINKKLSKRQMCKGGREHDWILCLPSYAQYADTSLGIEIAAEYYAIEDAREDAQIIFDEQLKAIGVKSQSFRIGKIFGRRRSNICSICLKRE